MFLTRLSTDDDPEPGLFVLTSPLIWDDALFGHIIVPRGFRTDLASYPGFLRGLPCFNVNGKSRRPAVVHDFLYALQIDKLTADMFLKASLLAEGVNLPCAQATYLGVHWFGRWAWKSDAGALSTRDFDTPENYQAWWNGFNPKLGISRVMDL